MKKVAPQQISYSTLQSLLGILNHRQEQSKQKDHVIAELTPKAED